MKEKKTKIFLCCTVCRIMKYTFVVYYSSHFTYISLLFGSSPPYPQQNTGLRAIGFNIIASLIVAAVINGALSYATLPVSKLNFVSAI